MRESANKPLDLALTSSGETGWALETGFEHLSKRARRHWAESHELKRAGGIVVARFEKRYQNKKLDLGVIERRKRETGKPTRRVARVKGWTE